MDVILQQLGGILLRALPTFFLVLLLHFYLKHAFFRPLERVLQKRYEATEGARKLAEASLEKASAKAAEYEAAIRAARMEIYQDQERFRRKMQEERSAALQKSRASAESAVKQAKTELAADVDQARQALGRESEALANQIAASILGRKVMA